MIAALRRLPAPLLVAQVGAIALSLRFVVRVLGDPKVPDDGALDTFIAGSWVAIGALSAVGFAWLSRRLAGPARRGIQLAFVMMLARLAWPAVSLAIWLCDVDFGPRAEWDVTMSFAILLAVGLGIAAGRWYWIVLGAVVAVVSAPALLFVGPVFRLLEDSPRGHMLLFSGLTLVSAVTTLAITAVACTRADSSAEPPQAPRGFHRIVLALYGLMIATTALVASTLLLEPASARGGTLVAYQATALIATGLVVASLVVLALGALDAVRVPGALPGRLVLASASVALSVAATTWARIHELVPRFFVPQRYEHLPTGFAGGFRAPEITLALAAQLLAACAVGGLLVAISIAARRRALEALRARTIASTGAFVALSLGAITAQRVLGAPSELAPLGIVALVMAHGALVAGWLVAARAVRVAAGELGEATLPAATLVKG